MVVTADVVLALSETKDNLSEIFEAHAEKAREIE
jgi:hypothetical protein